MSAPLKQTPVQRATEAWGETMPEWVRAVAEACEKETQAAVGKRFGYSGSTVNQLLSNTYRGDIGRVDAQAEEQTFSKIKEILEKSIDELPNELQDLKRSLKVAITEEGLSIQVIDHDSAGSMEQKKREGYF